MWSRAFCIHARWKPTSQTGDGRYLHGAPERKGGTGQETTRRGRLRVRQRQRLRAGQG